MERSWSWNAEEMHPVMFPMEMLQQDDLHHVLRRSNP